ncbi:iron reductase [Trametes meyenii]|nr:iron reductase [Trametes meyenii]
MSVSLTSAPVSPRAAANPDKPIRTGRNRAYPHQLWWLIASFVVLIALCQFISRVALKYSSRHSSRKKRGDTEAGRSSSSRRVSWRRLPLAALNAYRVIAFRWTLNIGQYLTLNFAEVLVTCVYIIAIFTWGFVNTTSLAGNKLDVSYWENRLGVLGASQLPLITALGTKNNILSYITGLKFIHRTIARIVFILLWTHGATRLAHLMDSQYVAWFVPIGIIAMGAFTVLLFVSLRPIRARFYELFYYTHVLSVLIILLGGYFHTNYQKFGFYLWPCFIIWGLDRAIRLGRLIFYNHLYFGFSATSHHLDASVELLSPHLVRLHLSRPPHFKWTPGQTVFLAMPSVSKFPIESHPFTIASVDARYALKGVQDATEAEKAQIAGEDVDATPYWNELVFLIHVREGYTRRLANAAEKGEKVKVLVDGPYGFSPNLDNDDIVVLIAGSSGVSYTLSTFLGVLSHVQKGKSKCRKLVFVWCIREASHIEWVSKALTKALELAPANIDLSVRIFVTSGSAPALGREGSWNEDESSHSSEGSPVEKTKPSSLFNFPSVQVALGRPNLAAFLQHEVEINTGRLSVTVCGSQGISRACRAALRIPVTTTLKGGPSVVLHVESFGYA